jgi:hypothetical protein
MKHLILVALAAGALLAVDATGTWTGTLTPASDGESRPALLVLKQEGDKLTGTAGPNADEQHPIQNGKADNGALTFEVPTGNSVMRFALKQDGDDIVGEITREQEGQKETAKLALKRTR